MYHVFFFFNLASCNGKYSSFFPSCNRRLGGGLLEKHSNMNVSKPSEHQPNQGWSRNRRDQTQPNREQHGRRKTQGKQTERKDKKSIQQRTSSPGRDKNSQVTAPSVDITAVSGPRLAVNCNTLPIYQVYTYCIQYQRDQYHN